MDEEVVGEDIVDKKDDRDVVVIYGGLQNKLALEEPYVENKEVLDEDVVVAHNVGLENILELDAC